MKKKSKCIKQVRQSNVTCEGCRILSLLIGCFLLQWFSGFIVVLSPEAVGTANGFVTITNATHLILVF